MAKTGLFTNAIVCKVIVVICWFICVAQSSTETGFNDLLSGLNHPFMRHVKAEDQDQKEYDETKRSLQKEIMKIFGVEHRPRPNLFYRFSGKQISARKYMIDLYNHVSKTESWVDGEEYGGLCYNCSFNDSNVVSADTVVSFVNHALIPRPNASDEEGALYFDLSSNVAYSEILGSELRLYRDKNSSKTSLGSNTSFRVKILQIITPHKRYDLIDSRLISENDYGWLLFNLSKTVRVWKSVQGSNNGVLISCETLGGRQISFKSLGFVGLKGPQEVRPFLVSFFITPRSEDILVEQIPVKAEIKKESRRKGRSVPSLLQSYIERTGKYESDLGQPEGSRRKRNSMESCRKQALYVSFIDLGWADWIIAPEGFKAFYCHGECPFPLGTNMNATNHAIVQTLAHLISPQTVPQPCCAPTRLSPITVLYLDDHSNVVIKKYQNMVVKACGCH